MAENIQKIQSFQENQVKLYYEKTMMFGDKYKEFKGTVGNMMEVKKTMANKMKSESGIMERLKNAYRWVEMGQKTIWWGESQFVTENNREQS